MTGAIAIFVKTPGYSPLKTRLTATTGQAFAEAWYRLAAQAVMEVVQQAATKRNLQSYWAVAEAEAIIECAWPSLEMLWQGEGELGRRMAHIHSHLVAHHGFGILLGADAPQLTTEDLCAAGEWLDSSEARQVIGPACDGGFWLFGANRVIPESIWKSVAYSQKDTAISFIKATQDGGKWLMLRQLSDVDRAEDLPICTEALRLLPNLTPAQQQVFELNKIGWNWEQP